MPTGEVKLPTAFAMVSQGRYAFAAASGPAVGTYAVVIHDLGGVVPEPTLDDARLLTKPGTQAASEILIDVRPGTNTMDFQVRH